MALARPKKKKLALIIIIIYSRIAADLDATPPVEGTIYEDIGSQLSQFQLCMWDSDEENWTAEEVDAWAAFEALAEQVEDDIDDLNKLVPVSEAFGAALSGI